MNIEKLSNNLSKCSEELKSKVANLHYAIQDGYYFQEEKDIDDELEELEAIIETINDDIRDLDNLIAKIGG